MQRAVRSICAAIIAALLAPALALATSTGIFGYSGKQMGRICTQCHSGGKAPDVGITGPLQVAAGSLSTFRITVKSNGGTSQRFAGFNVAASAGTLDVVDPTVQLSKRWPNGEISHSARKQNSNGQAFWDFTWQAPAQAGLVDIFGAGNSTNSGGNTTGDNATGTVFTVDVVAASPTPSQSATSTPSRTASPSPSATPTSTRTPTPTATPTTVPFTPTVAVAVAGDCDADGQITAADVERLVAMLTRCPPCGDGGVAAVGCAAVTGDCLAADVDHDGCIGAAELTRVLAM